jgi:hypothetical protein
MPAAFGIRPRLRAGSNRGPATIWIWSSLGFSAATHNCHIRRLQPRDGNRHAVFMVTESEAITYHYELDLRPDTLRPSRASPTR